MSTSDEQYLSDLYHRFRDQVISGEPVDYYDRDELLDIYDFAQDEGDVMVQLYVFLVASRLYHDADSFLGERMGFFVSYLDNRAGADMLARKNREPSALWDILAMGISNFPDGDPSEQLQAIIKKHRNLDSEAVIKIVDMLRDLNRLPLLFDNLKALAGISDDPRGLLYEAAQTAYDSGRYPQQARDIAEELTGSEPFNLDNWVLLARAELAMDHVAEAVTAAEYALALDPAYRPALLVRALAQVTEPDTRREAVAVLEKSLEGDPADTAAFRALVGGLKAEGENEKAARWLLWFIKNDPNANLYAATDFFSVVDDDELFADGCKTVLSAVDADENRWGALAAALDNASHPEIAVRLLEYYHTHCPPLDTTAELLITLHYRRRDFDGVIRVFSDCCKRGNEAEEATSDADGAPTRPQLSLTAFLLYAASLLMAGDYHTATDVARLVLKNAPAATTVDDKIRLQGIFGIARRVIAYAAFPTSIPDTPDFDILADVD